MIKGLRAFIMRGNAVAAIRWSGDAIQLQADNPDEVEDRWLQLLSGGWRPVVE